jgi:hypothetical protein
LLTQGSAELTVKDIAISEPVTSLGKFKVGDKVEYCWFNKWLPAVIHHIEGCHFFLSDARWVGHKNLRHADYKPAAGDLVEFEHRGKTLQAIIHYDKRKSSNHLGSIDNDASSFYYWRRASELKNQSP